MSAPAQDPDAPPPPLEVSPAPGGRPHDLLRLPPPWFLGLILALGVAVLYLNSLRGEWILDDYHDVLGPNAIQSLWPLSRHFFQQVRGEIFTQARPLASLTFAANHLFGRGDPFSFHVTNVAIHVLATLLLFGLIRRSLLLSPDAIRTPRAPLWLAFTTALLWGIHPLQTEAVAYITQRYESLMGLFVFATLLCVVRSVQSRHPAPWIACATLSSLLALASKEVAVALPILVLLYDRAFLAGSLRAAWSARRGLYMALGFVWGAFLWNQLHVIERTFAGFALPIPWWQYAMNQPTVILHYLRLVVWPHPLVLDYAWPAATSVVPLLPGLFLVGSLLAVTLVALWKSPRWGFLGAFFFAILAPTSSFMPILDLAVEHRMYLPLAAVLTALVLGLHFLALWIRAKRYRLEGPLHATYLCGGALAIALLGSLTFLRSSDYRRALGISRDTVLKRPNNPRAHMNLAFALNRAGNLEEAIRQARLAVRLAPDHFLIRVTLGAFLDLQGLSQEAIEELQHASQLNSGDPRPWMILGEIHSRMQNLEKARECFRAALARDPESPQAHYSLGEVEARKGELNAALRNYQQAVQLKQGFSPAHRGAGLVLLEQDRLDEALLEFEAYVHLEADGADALAQVGQALYLHERIPEAIRYWQRALQRDPRHVPTRLSMAWALSTHPLATVRNGAKALELVEPILRGANGLRPEVLEVASAAYAELGRFPEACAAQETAIQELAVAHSPRLKELQTRLALYRNAHPFRSTPRR